MNAIALLIAAIELIAPKIGEEIRLIPECQRTIITNETMEAREAIFAADSANGKKLRHAKEWRKSLPLVLKWKATAGETGLWEIKVGTKPDLSDARVWFMRKGEIDKATGREVDKKGKEVDTYEFEVPMANLEIATTYFWKITSNITCGTWGHTRTCGCKAKKPSIESEIGSFTTEDLAPRWIKVEGSVGNFRDLGGRIGMDGKRVRQGMIYRSQGLNENSADGVVRGKYRLTLEDLEYLTKTLGIKTDLDLRTNREVAGLNGVSPLGKEVKYIHNSSGAYDGVFKNNKDNNLSSSAKDVMATNFRVFCDERNYPILFHCIGGADRTGALGYVLNGVLGVKRQELETDWESTFYPNIPNKNSKGKLEWNSEQHFNNGFGKYGAEGDSWNRRIELYLLDCGVTQKEIEKFRSIMLK